MDSRRVVTVEIHGQRYPIRSGLDPAYVAELAAYVDEKMRLASRESPAGDTLKLAVLAALNIADECFRARDEGAAHRSDADRPRATSSSGCSTWRSARQTQAADRGRPNRSPCPDRRIHSKILRRSSSSLLCA